MPTEKPLRRGVAIWGAGETGRNVASRVRAIESLDIEHVVDSSPTKWGERFLDEFVVEAPSVLEHYKGELLVAAAGGLSLKRTCEDLGLAPNYEFNYLARQEMLTSYWASREAEIEEIRRNLHDQHSKRLFDFVSSVGPKTNQAILEMDVLESYFSAPFIPRRAEGTILIGGASVGEEIPFLNQLSIGFRQVVMVEPSPGAARELDTALSKTSLSEKGKIINAALGSQAGTAALVGQGVSARTMSGTPDSGQLVPVVTIDSLAVSHPDISFITLDVEGDEMVALEGGRKTIESCRPILAVSVYHNPEDLFDIWEFLKKTKVRYRYHLRALDFGICDLTLFAIPVPE